MKWRRLDPAGLDECVLGRTSDGWELRGEARFAQGRSQAVLTYQVRCDASFRTRDATVEGNVDGRPVSWQVSARRGQWLLNGTRRAEVDGCVDVDLAFTPATNLLAIRRLRLKVGESAAVRAAWLRFPRGDLRPLDQTYRRVDRDHYEYRSGDFAATILVDRRGFVRDYGDQWKAVDADPIRAHVGGRARQERVSSEPR